MHMKKTAKYNCSYFYMDMLLNVIVWYNSLFIIMSSSLSESEEEVGLPNALIQ